MDKKYPRYGEPPKTQFLNKLFKISKKKLFSLGLIAIACVLLIVFLVHQIYQAETVGSFNVSGTIYGQDTKLPLAGAAVSLFTDNLESDNAIVTAKTDASGQYSLSAPDKSYSHISITKANYWDMEGGIVNVSAIDNIKANIALKPGFGKENVQITALKKKSFIGNKSYFGLSVQPFDDSPYALENIVPDGNSYKDENFVGGFRGYELSKNSFLPLGKEPKWAEEIGQIPIQLTYAAAAYSPDTDRYYIFGGQRKDGTKSNIIYEYDRNNPNELYEINNLYHSFSGGASIYLTEYKAILIVAEGHTWLFRPQDNKLIELINDAVPEYDRQKIIRAEDALLLFGELDSDPHKTGITTLSVKNLLFGGQDVNECFSPSGACRITGQGNINVIDTRASLMPYYYAENKKIYLLGGRENGTISDAILELDPNNITQEAKELDKKLPFPLADSAYFATDNRLYLFGGLTDAQGTINTKTVTFFADDNAKAGEENYRPTFSEDISNVPFAQDDSYRALIFSQKVQKTFGTFTLKAGQAYEIEPYNDYTLIFRGRAKTDNFSFKTREIQESNWQNYESEWFANPFASPVMLADIQLQYQDKNYNLKEAVDSDIINSNVFISDYPSQRKIDLDDLRLSFRSGDYIAFHAKKSQLKISLPLPQETITDSSFGKISVDYSITDIQAIARGDDLTEQQQQIKNEITSLADTTAQGMDSGLRIVFIEKNGEVVSPSNAFLYLSGDNLRVNLSSITIKSGGTLYSFIEAGQKGIIGETIIISAADSEQSYNLKDPQSTALALRSGEKLTFTVNNSDIDISSNDLLWFKEIKVDSNCHKGTRATISWFISRRSYATIYYGRSIAYELGEMDASNDGDMLQGLLPGGEYIQYGYTDFEVIDLEEDLYHFKVVLYDKDENGEPINITESKDLTLELWCPANIIEESVEVERISNYQAVIYFETEAAADVEVVVAPGGNWAQSVSYFERDNSSSHQVYLDNIYNGINYPYIIFSYYPGEEAAGWVDNYSGAYTLPCLDIVDWNQNILGTNAYFFWEFDARQWLEYISGGGFFYYRLLNDSSWRSIPFSDNDNPVEINLDNLLPNTNYEYQITDGHFCTFAKGTFKTEGEIIFDASMDVSQPNQNELKFNIDANAPIDMASVKVRGASDEIIIHTDPVEYPIYQQELSWQIKDNLCSFMSSGADSHNFIVDYEVTSYQDPPQQKNGSVEFIATGECIDALNIHKPKYDYQNKKVTLSWDTGDKKTTSNLSYGQSVNYDHVIGLNTSSNSHQIVLENIEQDKEYHYQVEVLLKDALQNDLDSETSSDQIFNLASIIINNIQVTDITTNSAKISWDTGDTETYGKVEYGESDSYGSTTSAEGKAKTHQVTLENLSANLEYHFRVEAWTEDENQSVKSDDQTFKTSEGNLCNVSVYRDATSFGVAYNSSIPKRIDYGLTSEYGNYVDSGMMLEYGRWFRLIPDLEQMTRYHYKIDGCGEDRTTATGVEFSNVKIETEETSAQIEWDTSIAVDGEVQINGRNYPATSGTQHIVNIEGLEPATKYIPFIIAKKGDVVYSTNRIFTTKPSIAIINHGCGVTWTSEYKEKDAWGYNIWETKISFSTNYPSYGSVFWNDGTKKDFSSDTIHNLVLTLRSTCKYPLKIRVHREDTTNKDDWRLYWLDYDSEHRPQDPSCISYFGCSTGEMSFSTTEYNLSQSDVQALKVENLQENQKDGIVFFTTDQATESYIEYGTKKDQYKQKTNLNQKSTIHLTKLENLKSRTYHYRIATKDQDGKEHFSEDRILKHGRWFFRFWGDLWERIKGIFS